MNLLKCDWTTTAIEMNLCWAKGTIKLPLLRYNPSFRAYNSMFAFVRGELSMLPRKKLLLLAELG